MKYITDISKQTITIAGKQYGSQEIEKILPDIPGEASAHIPLVNFLQEWFHPHPYLTVQTSGSTGIPKQIQVAKQKMINSACMTCTSLGLEKEMRALLCMDLKYIGAKMMVVRALVSGMELVVRPASGHPLVTVHDPVDFTAMVPLQIYNTLQVPEEKEKLSHICHVLIGGSQIDPGLEKEIRQLPNAVYSTYGMTETLSHIALRKLTGADRSGLYIPLPGVRVTLSGQQTLVIQAPALTPGTVCTNDIAELSPEGHIRIIGRKDNIINSGGIKIVIEQMETELSPAISFPFAITSISDAKFGEITVVLIACTEQEKEQISLPPTIRYTHRPKHIFSVAAIPLTENEKKDRLACKRLAQHIYTRLILREK
ncbi:MAG: AMP-binding protein [Tannerellaceae bacterium]|nr:AMP-binding protein [Tannerellaceae bacterium]